MKGIWIFDPNLDLILSTLNLKAFEHESVEVILQEGEKIVGFQSRGDSSNAAH